MKHGTLFGRWFVVALHCVCKHSEFGAHISRPWYLPLKTRGTSQGLVLSFALVHGFFSMAGSGPRVQRVGRMRFAQQVCGSKNVKDLNLGQVSCSWFALFRFL